MNCSDRVINESLPNLIIVASEKSFVGRERNELPSRMSNSSLRRMVMLMMKRRMVTLMMKRRMVTLMRRRLMLTIVKRRRRR